VGKSKTGKMASLVGFRGTRSFEKAWRPAAITEQAEGPDVGYVGKGIHVWWPGLVFKTGGGRQKLSVLSPQALTMVHLSPSSASFGVRYANGSLKQPKRHETTKKGKASEDTILRGFSVGRLWSTVVLK
jgi:hypothetical protein